jgi:hypothetical protein
MKYAFAAFIYIETKLALHLSVRISSSNVKQNKSRDSDGETHIEPCWYVLHA